MLDLRDKLEMQDLIREMEKNIINYRITTSVTRDNGEIVYINLEVASGD